MYETATVNLSIPLLLKLLEFAREEALNDVDLHFVAENIIKLQWRGEEILLDMKDYKKIVDRQMPAATYAKPALED